MIIPPLPENSLGCYLKVFQSQQTLILLYKVSTWFPYFTEGKNEVQRELPYSSVQIKTRGCPSLNLIWQWSLTMKERLLLFPYRKFGGRWFHSFFSLTQRYPQRARLLHCHQVGFLPLCFLPHDHNMVATAPGICLQTSDPSRREWGKKKLCFFSTRWKVILKTSLRRLPLISHWSLLVAKEPREVNMP